MKVDKAAYLSLLPYSLRMRLRSLYRATRMVSAGSVPIRKKIGLRPEQLFAKEAQELVAKWDLDAALVKADAALSIDPLNQKALGLRARILSNLGHVQEAVSAARSLEAAYPVDINARRMLRALGQQPKDATIADVEDWIAAMRGRPSAYSSATAYLFELEKFEDTIRVADAGLPSLAKEKDPRRAFSIRGNLLYFKACSLEYLNRCGEAMAVFELMLDHEISKARGMVGIARCNLELGRPAEAEKVLRDNNAAGDDPLPFTPLTLDVLQAQHKIEESYRLYRKKPVSLAIAECFKLPPPAGLNLNSPIMREKNALILSEGGPGDELRLCAIYPELSACFRRIAITTDPRLHGIMQRTFPTIDFIPSARHRRELVRDMSDRKSIADGRLFQVLSDATMAYGRNCDIVCSTLDTLADLRPDSSAFANSPRRIVQPIPELKAKWAAKTQSSGRLKIGLAWRSMLQSVARNRHYLTADQLSPLAALDAEFWILQPKAEEREIEQLKAMMTIRMPDGLDLVNDIEGQVALIANLDAVISPFTTTGEMAGAVGIPAMLISTTRSTMWRRGPGGYDLWAPTAKIVAGDPIHNRVDAIMRAVRELRSALLQG